MVSQACVREGNAHTLGTRLPLGREGKQAHGHPHASCGGVQFAAKKLVRLS